MIGGNGSVVGTKKYNNKLSVKIKHQFIQNCNIGYLWFFFKLVKILLVLIIFNKMNTDYDTLLKY